MTTANVCGPLAAKRIGLIGGSKAATLPVNPELSSAAVVLEAFM